MLNVLGEIRGHVNVLLEGSKISNIYTGPKTIKPGTRRPCEILQAEEKLSDVAVVVVIIA